MEVKHNGFTLETDTVSPAGIAYLLQYGFAKSLQDCVAGLGKEVRTARDAGADDWAAFCHDAGFEGTDVSADVVVEALAAKKQQARLDAIIAGSVGSAARGPRKIGIDKLETIVAVEYIKAAYAKLGREYPKGKGSAAEIAKLVSGVLAGSKGAEIRAEASRRANAAPIGDDLAELLA